MNKIYLGLFAAISIICAFLLQDAGRDAAVSSTRPAGETERPQLAPLSDAAFSEAVSDGEFDPARLARDMAAAAHELAQELAQGCPVVEGKVKKGETLAGLLEKAHRDDAADYVAAARKVFPPHKLRAGQPYAISSEDGRLRRFEYEVDADTCLVVEGCDLPRARLEKMPSDVKLHLAKASIDDNLFKAVDDIGENPLLAARLVELFGSEINFIRDVRPGDGFEVLIEKKYRKGVFRGYGRITAARFSCKGKTFEAFMLADGAGKPRYYNRKGENLKKTLLQAPLAVTRVTSRFSHNRKHPILGASRPHLGVDYGAPHGTPVKAVGEGVVVLRGRVGGYGNQIVLRHEAGLESMYAHLSGYARGVREGARVRQGQVIGYVGSTGLATGPHLDFRLKQNGVFINPEKAVNPRGASVPRGKMAEFSYGVKSSLAFMSGEKPLAEYSPQTGSTVRKETQAETRKEARRTPAKQATRAKQAREVRKAKRGSPAKEARRTKQARQAKQTKPARRKTAAVGKGERRGASRKS